MIDQRFRGPKTRNKASRIAAAPFQQRLVIMAKAARMGRVKTRLAADVGCVEAVRFYRHTVQRVIDRLGHDRRWHTSLAIAPDQARNDPLWPSELVRQGQGLGNLGERMQRIMDDAGPGPVIIVGTDIPGITPQHIAKAFSLLKRHDAVLGPAPDGGYWLVGLRRYPCVQRIFQDIQWSSATTLTDTAANVKGRTARTSELGDVDCAADLAACRTWFGRRVLPVGPTDLRPSPAGAD
jgi:uncharacterized protein